jgi:hypothetical protein
LENTPYPGGIPADNIWEKRRRTTRKDKVKIEAKGVKMNA